MILTFTLKTDTAIAPDWCGMMVDDGAGLPVTQAAFGYQNAGGQVRFFRGAIGATGPQNVQITSSQIGALSAPRTGTGNAVSTAADYFRSLNRYSGTFASGNWSLNLVFRATTAGMQGSITSRFWAGPNQSGTGARGIGAATQSGAINLAALNTDYTAVVSVNMGSTITMNNEYLFLQQEWAQVNTTTGFNAFYRCPASFFTTTDFTPVAAGMARAIITG